MYMHTYIYDACTHIYIYRFMPVYLPMYIHTCVHTYIFMNVCCINMDVNTNIHTYTKHVCLHTYTQ